ncbi:hypothetical protein B484DRAFT_403534 [Ochromonadaceae sp. CCMP2298]|nr:hypothetical protein B484DRAFT_403534 [Ochromonadaceae sp. CCMP2298]
MFNIAQGTKVRRPAKGETAKGQTTRTSMFVTSEKAKPLAEEPSKQKKKLTKITLTMQDPSLVEAADGVAKKRKISMQGKRKGKATPSMKGVGYLDEEAEEEVEEEEAEDGEEEDEEESIATADKEGSTIDKEVTIIDEKDTAIDEDLAARLDSFNTARIEQNNCVIPAWLAPRPAEVASFSAGARPQAASDRPPASLHLKKGRR